MANIIKIKDLKKHFKVHKKEQGLKASFKSLFSRKFEIVKALDGIDLEIEKGEIHGFIGPNGAGKSTTIKILSGILYPSSGEVTVNNFHPWHDRKKYVETTFNQKP